jgi:hypothetical protein
MDPELYEKARAALSAAVVCSGGEPVGTVGATPASAVEALGSIDVLINNAGIQIGEESEAASIDNVSAVLDVNLKGAFLCARQAIRHFLDTGRAGVIVNISSVHELIPKPRYIGYAMMLPISTGKPFMWTGGLRCIRTSGAPGPRNSGLSSLLRPVRRGQTGKEKRSQYDCPACANTSLCPGCHGPASSGVGEGRPG